MRWPSGPVSDHRGAADGVGQKKWKADEVSAFDGSLEEAEDWKFRNYLSLRLTDGLWGKQSDQQD
jgi:hypothetical protein